GCAELVHLNNAGAALCSSATIDTVVAHLELEGRIGGYEAAAVRAPQLDATRRALAELLGASIEEVALTGNDTASWTKAFWGFVMTGGLRTQRRIVVDRAVYNSHHLAVLQAVRHLGLTVDVVAPGDDGPIDLVALSSMLGPDVGLLTVTHVPTHAGVVAPVHEVGELARAAGVPFFLDACQSVGQLRVDVAEIGCDVATLTGRKWLRGPRGTGALFVRADFLDRLDPPGVDASSAQWSVHGDDYTLAADATRFEEFETAVAARLGLGNAVQELLALGIEAVHARIGELADHLRSLIEATPDLHGEDPVGPRSGIVTFSVAGRAADDVAEQVSAAGINVSVSRAANSRLDFDARGLDTLVRAAPHIYNTTDELERLVDALGSG
ncbi:MAG: aminotransferase class V-fold PLP-dependent enzyme, partial [Microthrixaceae bacterium]